MGNTNGKISMAYNCITMKDYLTAIALFLSGDNVNSLSGDDYYYLALCYIRINDAQKFNIYYKKAFMKKSYVEFTMRKINMNNIMNYAQLCLDRFKFYSALQYYDLLKILSKDDLKINFLYSLCHFNITNNLDENIIDIAKKKFKSFENMLNCIKIQCPKIISEQFIEAIADVLYHNEIVDNSNYRNALYLYSIYIDHNKNNNINYKIAMCHYKLCSPNYIKFYVDSIGSELEVENRSDNIEILRDAHKSLEEKQGYYELL